MWVDTPNQGQGGASSPLTHLEPGWAWLSRTTDLNFFIFHSLRLSLGLVTHLPILKDSYMCPPLTPAFTKHLSVWSQEQKWWCQGLEKWERLLGWILHF